MATKKEIPLTREDKFYKMFDQMSKVNFLGYILRRYFRDQLIGKDENDIEYQELSAIVRIIDDKFMSEKTTI